LQIHLVPRRANDLANPLRSKRGEQMRPTHAPPYFGLVGGAQDRSYAILCEYGGEMSTLPCPSYGASAQNRIDGNDPVLYRIVEDRAQPLADLLRHIGGGALNPAQVRCCLLLR
jgi:hypothetical protein